MTTHILKRGNKLYLVEPINSEFVRTSVEQIALKIAYFDGQGVDRWRVHGRREEIETALKNIGMLNAETRSTITNFIDSCRESMGDISEYYND